MLAEKIVDIMDNSKGKIGDLEDVFISINNIVCKSVHEHETNNFQINNKLEVDKPQEIKSVRGLLDFSLSKNQTVRLIKLYLEKSENFVKSAFFKSFDLNDFVWSNAELFYFDSDIIDIRNYIFNLSQIRVDYEIRTSGVIYSRDNPDLALEHSNQEKPLNSHIHDSLNQRFSDFKFSIGMKGQLSTIIKPFSPPIEDLFIHHFSNDYFSSEWIFYLTEFFCFDRQVLYRVFTLILYNDADECSFKNRALNNIIRIYAEMDRTIQMIHDANEGNISSNTLMNSVNKYISHKTAEVEAQLVDLFSNLELGDLTEVGSKSPITCRNKLLETERLLSCIPDLSSVELRSDNVCVLANLVYEELLLNPPNESEGLADLLITMVSETGDFLKKRICTDQRIIGLMNNEQLEMFNNM